MPKFFSDGKPLYAPAGEHHIPYFSTYRELMGREANREYSFVAHHMIFRSDIVLELLSSFISKQPWWEAIMGFVTPRPPLYSGAQFSEFETYGHFLKERHPEEYRLRALHWLAEPGTPTHHRLKSIARRYDFATFHDHQRQWSLNLYENAKRAAKIYLLPRRNGTV